MKWRSELLLYPCSIQPRAGYAFPNEADHASDARILDDLGKPLRVSSHGIEHVALLHQVMVPLHDVPVMGETVLVLIAMMYFHQNARFDGPAGARAQVASLVQVQLGEGLDGYPHMSPAFQAEILRDAENPLRGAGAMEHLSVVSGTPFSHYFSQLPAKRAGIEVLSLQNGSDFRQLALDLLDFRRLGDEFLRLCSIELRKFENRKEQMLRLDLPELSGDGLPLSQGRYKPNSS